MIDDREEEMRLEKKKTHRMHKMVEGERETMGSYTYLDLQCYPIGQSGEINQSLLFILYFS